MVLAGMNPYSCGIRSHRFEFLTLLIVLEALHTDQALILEQVDGSHAFGVPPHDADVAGRGPDQYTAVA